MTAEKLSAPGPLCTEKTRSGDPCRATAGADGRCFWHSDRFSDAERRAAAIKGGYLATQRVMLDGEVPPVDLSNEDGARKLLEQTIDQVRTGKIASTVANSIFNGLTVAIRLAELKLAAQVAQLEAELDREERGR
jgi:hypothetical protein